MTIDAIVWDMDGTLVDSATIVPDAFLETLTDLGGPPATREEVVASYALGPPGPMLTGLLGRPATSADVEHYHRVLQRTAARVAVYPGVKDVLTVLEGQMPMAVFTGASHTAATLLLRAAAIDQHFTRVIGGDQVARVKPAPDGIIAAAESLSVPPGSIGYVGDSPNDMAAARAAGAVSIAAGWGHLFDPAAPADYVLSHPRDLLDQEGLRPRGK